VTAHHDEVDAITPRISDQRIDDWPVLERRRDIHSRVRTALGGNCVELSELGVSHFAKRVGLDSE
jgi:hypothetical protein